MQTTGARQLDMDEGTLLVSGLPAKMCHAMAGQLDAALDDWTAWHEGTVITSVDPIDELTEDILQAHQDGLALAFYQAPWIAVQNAGQTDPRQVLSTWLAYNKRLLRIRQIFKDRVLLLNADKLETASESLLRELHARAGLSLPADEIERFSEVFKGTGSDHLACIRSKLFEWLAPECWDLYEALEACAWLGDREPEFRSTLPMPAASALGEIICEWQDARRLPQLQLEHKEAERQVQQRASQLEAQLAQMRTQYGECLADLEQVKGELEHSLTSLDRAESEHNTAHNAWKVERATLGNQLAKAASDAAEANGHAQKIENGLRQQIQDAAEKEARLAKQLIEMQSRTKDAEHESELLLSQLHQVQEELEQVFLKAESASKEREKERETERKAFEAEKSALKSQLAKALADLAQANSRAQTLEKDLKQRTQDVAEKAKQIDKQRSDLEQISRKLETISKEREGERKAVETEKLAVKNEIAKANTDLTQANSRAQTLEKDLKQRTQDAVEKENQLRKQLDELKRANADSEKEGELMLLQLHEVQEELERYYLENQEMKVALDSATKAFHRARHTIAQLAVPAVVPVLAA